MCRLISVVVVIGWLPAFAGMTEPAGMPYAGIGRAATPDEIAAWDIDVRPDFKGLPKGSGSVADGQKIWDAKCASCHGTFGESNQVFSPLVGGTTAADAKVGRVKSLVTGDVARTTLMKVSTVATLWDYIRRAMPWNAPKSLTNDEVYAVLAYLLNLGDILPDNYVLSNANIAEVQEKLPNRNGVTRNHGLWDVKGKPDVVNAACMNDCETDVRLASSFPEHARGSHGDLSQQNRLVGATSSAPVALPQSPPIVLAQSSPVPPELARTRGCLACHGVDTKIVGPAFKTIARKYKGDDSAERRIAENIRRGTTNRWGAIPMPPNTRVTEVEAAVLAHWIMGL